MKLTFNLFVFLVSVLGFGQVPQCNPMIKFSYDNNGTLQSTQYVTKPCIQNSVNKSVASSVEVHPTTEKQSISSSLEVTAFPNPTIDFVTVELKQDSLKGLNVISLFDINGRQVFSETTSLVRLQINMNALAQGIYYMKVSQSGATAGCVLFKQ